MKNLIRTLCFALSLVTASASASSVNACDVVGSYINIRTITVPVLGNLDIMTQLQLHADGTVWVDSSSSDVNPITSGFFSQGIGAWQLKKDIVTLTFITWGTTPVTVDECCDVDVTDWERFTQEFRVLDKNTLESIESVSIIFPTSADTNTVLTGPGTVFGTSTTPLQYKKVHVVPSDL